MHYYGYYNHYGIGTRSADDNERMGYVEVFDSKRERDEWVSKDEFDGNYHREAISYEEAIREIKDVVYAHGIFDPRYDCPSTFSLLEAYKRVRS